MAVDPVEFNDPGWCAFDTALGRCGIAWGAGGIVAVDLPQASDARLQARLAHAAGGADDRAPPAAVRRVIDGIRALLRGESVMFADAPLDLGPIPDFDRRVYALALAIAPGTTATYGELAAQLGEPGAARSVGQALARNPWPIVVPCHRVLSAGDALGGFSAHGGQDTKRKLLAIEGARRGSGPDLFA